MGLIDEYLKLIQRGERAARDENRVVQRLYEHFSAPAQAAGELAQGEVNMGNITRLLGAPMPFDDLGLIMEGSGNVARAATGATLAGLGALPNRRDEYGPAEAALQGYQQTEGNLYDRFVAANEEAAGQDRFLTFLMNSAMDPTNLVSLPVSKAAQAGKAARRVAREGAGASLSDEFTNSLSSISDIDAAGIDEFLNPVLDATSTPTSPTQGPLLWNLDASGNRVPLPPGARDASAEFAARQAKTGGQSAPIPVEGVPSQAAQVRQFFAGFANPYGAARVSPEQFQRLVAKLGQTKADEMVASGKWIVDPNYVEPQLSGMNLQQVNQHAAPQATAQSLVDPTLTAADEALPERTVIDQFMDFAGAGQRLREVRTAGTEAAANIDEAKILYHAAQRVKDAAVREVNKRFPVKQRNTPEYLQAVEDAKNAALPDIEGLPRRGQTYGQYMSEQSQPKYGARADEKKLVQEIKGLRQEPGAELLPEKVGGLSVRQPEPDVFDIEGYRIDPNTKQRLRDYPERPRANDQLNAEMGLPPGPTRAQTEAAKRPEVPMPELVKTLDEVTTKSDDAARGAQTASTPTTEELDEMNWGQLGARLVHHAFKQGWEAQQAAMSRKGGHMGFGEVASVWKGALVQTPRNIFMDEAYSRLVAANEGISRRFINNTEKWIVARLLEGEKNPMILFGSVSDDLVRTGVTDVLDPKKAPKFVERAGGNPLEIETEIAQSLNAFQMMVAETGLSLANPLRTGTSLAALPYIMARGYLAPMRHEVFRIVNSVTHLATRSEAFRQGFEPYIKNSADRLLAAARAEGKDVGELANEKGLFSPERVRGILGDRYATEWERMRDEAVEAGFSRAKQVYGDFANRRGLERGIDKVAPFMSWAWRAYPRTAMMVMQHPAVQVAAYHMYRSGIDQAERGEIANWQIGTIPVSAETPFIGALVNALTPEQEGSEMRLNPLSLVNPLGGEAVGLAAGVNEGGEKNLYQNIEAIMGAAGMSPNPLIQAGAYGLGWDYRKPGPLSRYSNIDQSFDERTGVEAEIPSLAHGPLGALREKVTGKKDYYDPVESKAEELVFDRTGLPISDERNKQYAIQVAKKEGIYQEAERALDIGNSRRAAIGAFTPVSISVQTEEAKKARIAKKDIPYTYDEIKAIRELHPVLADIIEQDNQDYKKQNPAAAMGERGRVDKKDLQDERLTAWEQDPINQAMARANPAAYRKMRKDFMRLHRID